MRLFLLTAGITQLAMAPLQAQVPAGPTGSEIEQLGAPDRDIAAGQLGNPADRAFPAQLDPAARLAMPPEPPSRPGDGRPTAVVRLNGSDRCDPAAPARTRVPACAAVIESRGGDYARPPVALTPEERLLVRQHSGSPGTLSDARRVAANPGGNSDQAVASIVLQGPAPPPPPGVDKADPTGAAIDAIVDGATRTPPR